MKKHLHFLSSAACVAALLFSYQTYAQNVTIIESLSGNSWAVQDSLWYHVASNMGYHAAIVQQDALDDLSNFDSTDVLIVSSGTIVLPQNRIQTVVDFVKGGRPAYIQSEYLGTYGGDITWDSLMHAVNGNFNWVGTVSGSLVPMNVLGTFATTPNNVPTLDYFNYGYAGDATGTDVKPFLEYLGSYFGFFYFDSTTCYGTAITVSDEDWVWLGSSPELMTNMLYKLVQYATHFSLEPASVNVEEGSNTSFTVTTTLASVSYQWQVNDGNGWVNVTNGGVYSGANTATLILTGVGENYDGYQYRCVVSAECGNFYSDAATLTVYNTQGVPSPNKFLIAVYPNPFTDYFAIRFSTGGKYSITLINSMGEIVFSQNATVSSLNDEMKLPARNLSSGIYSLLISDGKNSVRKTIECAGGK